MFRLLIGPQFYNVENRKEQIAEFQFSDDAKLVFDKYVEGNYNCEVRGRGLFYSEEVLFSHDSRPKVDQIKGAVSGRLSKTGCGVSQPEQTEDQTTGEGLEGCEPRKV